MKLAPPPPVVADPPPSAAATPKRETEEQKLFRLASATRFDTVLTGAIFRRYADRYRAIVAEETAGFESLALPDPEMAALRVRVTTAIRRVASFSAWYDVVRTLFRVGYTASWFAGYAAVAIFIGWSYGHRPAAPTAVAAALAGVVMVVLAERGARLLSRRWPLDAIALIVVIGALSVLFRTHDQWKLADPLTCAALAAASGLAGFASVLLITLLGVHRCHSWVTAAKLRTYPEDEIIESLTALLVKLKGARGAWVSGRLRARIVDDLDWIARRFEFDLLGRFRRGDPATEAWITLTGARLAAACRLRERAAGFPERGTMDRVAAYALGTLLHAAAGDWSRIEQADALEEAPQRRWIDRVADYAKIGIPALTGFIVFHLPGLVAPELRENALFTGILASIVALWGVLDPQHFEKGLDTTKTLGDILQPRRA